MKLKPEIIQQIRESYSLRGMLIASVAGEKSPRTIEQWVRDNNEQLTLARFLFPISAHLRTPIEDLIDIS
jgi:hypothetical protein